MSDSEDKYGKKIEYDPLWKGPMDIVRSSTDQSWIIIFIIFMAIYVSSATYGLIIGDFKKLAGPIDYAGRLCGIDSDVKDKPYLLYIHLKDGITRNKLQNASSVCISQCPTKNFIYKRDSNAKSLEEIKKDIYCTTDVNITSISSFNQLDTLILYNKCTECYLKSEPVGGKCMAFNAWEGHERETMSSDDLCTVREQTRQQEYMTQTVYNDINSALCPTIIAILCGGIIVLLYVVSLNWFAVPFFYASICMLITFMVGVFSVLCVSYHSDRNGRLLFNLIAIALLIVIVIIEVVYFRRKIYLACQIIKESNKAVIHLSSTLLFSILPWILYIGIIIFSIRVAVSFLSVTEPDYRIEKLGTGIEDGCNCTNLSKIVLFEGASCDPTGFNDKCNLNGQPCQFLKCRLFHKTNPPYFFVFHLINFFGLLWLIFFICGYKHMVLSGTFATWYWTFNKSNVKNRALLESMNRTTRYHLGTIAVGSLILTISKIIRIILKAINSTLEEGNNAVASGFIYCCRFCYDVLDSLINFLNYNAYIMCAIHGKSFFQSAKSAFNLIMRNVGNIIVADLVVDCVLLMAKLLITSITVAGITLYCIYNDATANTRLETAIIMTAIGTYIIASVFFSVQSIAVNTIFLCFIEDSERNDGSDQKPYYMSNKLKQLLREENL